MADVIVTWSENGEEGRATFADEATAREFIRAELDKRYNLDAPPSLGKVSSGKSAARKPSSGKSGSKRTTTKGGKK